MKSNPRIFAVTFGAALNLNVHFHTLAVQNVFVDDGAVGFASFPTPSRDGDGLSACTVRCPRGDVPPGLTPGFYAP
jgi:hypothetical protein